MPASNPDRFDTEAQDVDYLGGARELAPTLAAAADEIERRRELPEAVVAALVERGLYRLLLPRSLGGAELLPPDFVPVIEEIAKSDASTAWCLNQATGCSMTAAYLEPEAACEIFGGPRGILAWGPGPGAARIVDGGYRVTASWSFASGSTMPPGSVAMSRSSRPTGRRATTPMAAQSSARCYSRNRMPG
jgi:alkylation response protein AidB-like acyl-CoA dehydrogenase